jgi:hypothetical protein
LPFPFVLLEAEGPTNFQPAEPHITSCSRNPGSPLVDVFFDVPLSPGFGFAPASFRVNGIAPIDLGISNVDGRGILTLTMSDDPEVYCVVLMIGPGAILGDGVGPFDTWSANNGVSAITAVVQTSANEISIYADPQIADVPDAGYITNGTQSPGTYDASNNPLILSFDNPVVLLDGLQLSAALPLTNGQAQIPATFAITV